ncbi:MAG: hypothetical protein AAGE05_04555 [Pseudomonadota bacterium]
MDDPTQSLAGAILARIDRTAVAMPNSDARAYLFRARMPFVERRDGCVLSRDRRFTFDGIGDRFTVDVTPSE